VKPRACGDISAPGDEGTTPAGRSVIANGSIEARAKVESEAVGRDTLPPVFFLGGTHARA